MSTFVAICYPDPYRAQEARLAFAKLQKEYLIDIEDAVVAVKNEKGKIKLHQSVNLTAAGAVTGGFWGTLIGLFFLNPLFGAAVGAAAGAVSGALNDIGIDDKMMKAIADKLQPNSSALFVLVRNVIPDKVIPEIQKYGGTLLQTNLSHEDEVRLQAALNDARGAAGA